MQGNLQSSRPQPEDSMEISMQSDTIMQPSVTSPSAVSQCSSVNKQVMDQFGQMKTMLSSFFGPRQETTRIVFCNYLASELEALEDRDFQTFKDKTETFKQHPEQGRGRSHQHQQPQQPKHSRIYSAISTYMPQTFQQPQQPAPAATEYILTPRDSDQARSSNQLCRAKWEPKDSSNPEGS